MKFFDDAKKSPKWWSRNYFFVGTIAVIALNILLFVFLGNNWESAFKIQDGGHWGDVFYFAPTIRVFMNSFSHANWQHVLLNMLCFLFVGIYLERKTGSFGMILLVAFSAYVSSIAVATNDLSVYFHGYSAVNYFLYGYVLIDFIFSFTADRRSKCNTILGAIVIASIYIFMCYAGGVSGFEFRWYPYDLMTNLAHYSSFVAGIIIPLFINAVSLIRKKNSVE